jgi:hypothetical protein
LIVKEKSLLEFAFRKRIKLSGKFEVVRFKRNEQCVVLSGLNLKLLLQFSGKFQRAMELFEVCRKRFNGEEGGYL